MNKLSPILTFFLDRPITAIAFFFSFIPFWAVVIWYSTGEANWTTAGILLVAILIGKCIINAEIMGKGPFTILIDKIIYYSLWVTGNLLLFILLIILIILFTITTDILFKFIITGIIFMAILSTFIIKHQDYLKNVWSVSGANRTKHYFWLSTAVLICWLIFLFIPSANMKYISIGIISVLELIRFARTYDSII